VKPLLSVGDIKALASVGDDKIYQWINDGITTDSGKLKLPAIDVSLGSKRPRWKVDPRDLEGFLAKLRPSSHRPRPAGGVTAKNYIR
jgi:hypothetical protein